LLTGELPYRLLSATFRDGFNPHPSLLTGEFDFAVVVIADAIAFQSTPVIADG